MTPLSYTAIFNSVFIFDYLIEMEVDLNNIDFKGNSVLHYAITMGNELAAVKILETRRFDPDVARVLNNEG